jgi:ADP-heptose:LPS heptosyltransferase
MKQKKYDSTRGRKSLKIIDRYLGIPIIAALSLLKQKRKFPQDIRHIGLLKTGAIGDTVLILGILEDIRNTYPDVKITAFLGSSNSCMAEFMQSTNIVILPVTNPIKSIQLIRQEECDVFIDFGQWPRLDALLSAFSGASFCVGFQTPQQHRSTLYDIPIPHSKAIHSYSNFKNLISAIGVNQNNKPLISLGRERQNEKTIAIHMFPGGSQSKTRRWPLERWLQLIDFITSKNFTVILTGAKVDAPEAEAIKKQVTQPEHTVVKAGCSLRETCDALYDSDLVISVDTGILHVAAALGCKIVSLHGPAPVSLWGPISDTAICLIPSEDCIQCSYLGFEKCSKSRQCIDDISVNQVIAAINQLLAYHTSANGQP